MKKIKKFVFNIHELSFISLIFVLSALIYTVYILNSSSNVAPQKTQAAGAICKTEFQAVPKP
ncbi:hypothetical protein A2W14_07060 [Candidatus Gottesmanbacteria bacterium RBG_16_37_8]|uniref:Uncharacterized protein n=1 Tax=Candidatus Gottesmanbacteria bacterium RBG_16_37_8 TaxID=1798371 RepID=A0A1F5YT16_9BACT|nr:MAG: hypothetical protein A2W14_07060 [Candidatus Gottesmanbacteria bacterium RBG_16_37_8]